MVHLPKTDQKSCGSSASPWQTVKSTTGRDSSKPNWDATRGWGQSAKSIHHLGSRGGSSRFAPHYFRSDLAALGTLKNAGCLCCNRLFRRLVYRRISQKHPSQRRSSLSTLGGGKIQGAAVGKIASRSRFRARPNGTLYTARDTQGDAAAIPVGNRAGARQSD